MKTRYFFTLFVRYALLFAIGAFGMGVVYSILTPITVYSSFLLLKLFYAVSLEGSKLILEKASINLITACIAGAAYYLLLILNLSTSMPFKLRLKSLSFSFVSLFILNLLRIVLFAVLFVEGFSYFDVMHQFIWYFGSTVLVVAVWFLNVSLFKIKVIPAYTDLKNLLGAIKSKGRNKR